MRIPRSELLLGAVLAIAGCGDSPTGIARSAAGPWTETQLVPGSSLQVTLTASGATLSGTGTWSGEAFASGPVAATGSVNGDTVVLDFVLTAALPNGVPFELDEHFSGHLELGKLTGTMIIGPGTNPTTQSATFVRP